MRFRTIRDSKIFEAETLDDFKAMCAWLDGRQSPGRPERPPVVSPARPAKAAGSNAGGTFLKILETVMNHPDPNGIPSRDLSDRVGLESPKALGGFVSGSVALLGGKFEFIDVVERFRDSEAVRRWRKGPKIVQAVEYLRSRLVAEIRSSAP